MKRLYIVRHSKSDWASPGKADMDRPLNERGRNDAINVSAYLKGKNYIPQLILCSPAERTKETSLYFQKHYDGVNIELDEHLYLGDIDDIINSCIHLSKDIESIMLFCHNPGITYFANVICDANIDNVPTTGVLVIDVDTEEWIDMDMSKLKLVDFIYPKNIKK